MWASYVLTSRGNINFLPKYLELHKSFERVPKETLFETLLSLF
jgi:hypothetical protein